MKNNNNNNNTNTTLTKKGTNNMTQLYVIRRNTTVLHTTDNLKLTKFKFQLYSQYNKNHVLSVREYSPTVLGKCLARHTGSADSYMNNL